MAVLSDCGAHCALVGCSQLDFLPFKCDMCEASFCLEHFRYAAHECPKAAGLDNRVLVCPFCRRSVPLLAGQDPNHCWHLHSVSNCPYPNGEAPARRQARCPVAGCKQVLALASSLVCARCDTRVCLKHRYEDAHTCVASSPPSKIEARPVGGLRLTRVRASVSHGQGGRKLQNIPRRATAGLRNHAPGIGAAVRTPAASSTATATRKTVMTRARMVPAASAVPGAGGPKNIMLSTPVIQRGAVNHGSAVCSKQSAPARPSTGSGVSLQKGSPGQSAQRSATTVVTPHSGEAIGTAILFPSTFPGDADESKLLARVLQSKVVLENPERSTQEVLLTTLHGLSSIRSLPTKMLSDTKIGLVVNQLAKNPAVHETVHARARKLLAEWRTMHRKRKVVGGDHLGSEGAVSGTGASIGNSARGIVEASKKSGHLENLEDRGQTEVEAKKERLHGKSSNWCCMRCTFHNLADALICGACEVQRQDESEQWGGGILQSAHSGSVIDLSD